MRGTKEVRRNSASVTIRKSLQIIVSCTDPALAPVAMNAAVGMAGDLEAVVTQVYVHVVPFPLSLDRPDVRTEYLVRTLTGSCDAGSIPVRLLVVMARDREAAIRRLVPAGSLVVLATRKRWWRTAEESLARTLQRDGHGVVLLKLNAAGNICDESRVRAIQGEASQESREVRPNHA